MPLKFSEKYGGRRWTRTRTGWSGTRVFIVPNTLPDLARLPPVGSKWRVAENVDMTCIRHDYADLGNYQITAGGWAVEGYMVTVEYQSVPLATDPIVTFDVEAEALSSGRLREYKSDGEVAVNRTADLYPTIGVNVEVQMQDADLHTYFGLTGKINNSPVGVLGRYTWGARKFLFVGVDTRTEVNESGILVYHCHFRFIYRPNIPSWNHVWRNEPYDAKGKWDELVPPIYAEADFSPLQWLLNGGKCG